MAAIACFVCLNAFNARPGPDETLYWLAPHRLTFADFRGKPPEAGPTKRGEGGLAGTIIKSIVADTKIVNGRTVFIVYASMKPNRSWITKKGDSTALRHEQGHFDICEIYARSLRRELRDAGSVEEAKTMWNHILDQEETEQNLYDKANGYLEGGMTAAWKNKIQKQLKNLEAYARPEVPAVKLH